MTAAAPSDLLICLLILALALGALADASLFRGVTLYIAFGLVLALSWTRLQAPDLALAEAALGAGVIGALLLASLKGLNGSDPVPGMPRSRVRLVVGSSGALLVLFGVLVGALGVFGAWAIPDHGLIEPVFEALHLTGVSNPVTAVILNYRAYDTFLEIGVLYLVMLCVFALQPEEPKRPSPAGGSDQLLLSYTRGIVPLMILAAGYLLWAGAFRPGGAFQAGAMLGGAGILLHVSRPSRSIDLRGPGPRIILTLGLLSFIGLGVFAMLAGLAFLQWPAELAKHAILAVETASTLSIGLTLTALYAGVEGRLIAPAGRCTGKKEE